MSILDIGFFGDGGWSHNGLRLLLDDPKVNINFICARYENPDEILKKIAKDYNIKFVTNKNINSREFYDFANSFKSQLFVSMSFNQIFQDNMIDIPPLGIINCHAGKLPFYRGRNVLNWALINDEKEFGITVHYIDRSIDTGDIILQTSHPISDEDDYSSLLDRSFVYCADNLYRAIKLIHKGEVKRIPQSEIDKKGSYCKRRKVGDEWVDWHQSSRKIFNFIRGISTPGPNAQSMINNKIIRIVKADLLKVSVPIGELDPPGTIIDSGDSFFVVKTIDGSIRVTKWIFPDNLVIGETLHCQ
jgi:methionyl-tRNA formyltransferase